VVLWDKKCSVIEMLSIVSPQGPLRFFNHSVPGLAAACNSFPSAAVLR